MSKVITFSRQFPAYHPKAGQPTFFVEKFWLSLYNKAALYNDGLEEERNNIFRHNYPHKNHTIRAGNRFKVGDEFSPRVWGTDINPKSGKSGPYHSKQIKIAADIRIKKIYDFEIIDGLMFIDETAFCTDRISVQNLEELALNDGLEVSDFLAWFKYPAPFKGQIICWNDVKY